MKYAREIPLDKNSTSYSTTPSFTAYQAQSGVPTASSVITFTDKTTVVDVMAISTGAATGGIIGKWGSASVTVTNFDFQVNAGQNRTFVIPQSIMGTASISGANVSNGLYPNMAVKYVGTATSILTAEY